ncbi:type III secretion system inner membrane ring lipoprotein SctJ [Pandoraea commovens]|uniref:Lipoprotein n=1 Tax=Pandoraea commovens TaxID=2508289 RepID=A0A5E4W9J5_9BURK|nr:type III secretion inner membrane ring lipoprotein SctJ [Pandoraea commovens]VVE20206.1 EscJ/YscJ/HrcJ family type III secretion inner membrane ring protein [Pandoraea commovens]
MTASLGRFLRLTSLAFVLILVGCSDRSIELVRSLPESEANAVVSALAAVNIVSSKSLEKDGSVTVRVSSSREAEALAQLRAYGLPRRNFATLGEVFKKDGIVSSPLEEQARYVYALAQELEDTLSQLDDVVYVRVLPVLPKKASLTGPEIKATAGVFIKHRPSADLADMVPMIRDLVAHSVPELDASRVSVVISPADDTFAPGMPNPGMKPKSSQTAMWIGLLIAMAGIGSGGAGYWWWRRTRMKSDERKTRDEYKEPIAPRAETSHQSFDSGD